MPDSSLQKKPSLDKAHALNEAHALRRQGQWDEAARLYEHFLARFPKDVVAQHNLALCVLATGDANTAARLAMQVLNKQPSLWQTSLILAKSLQQIGRKTDALALLEQLKAKHPDNRTVTLAWARLQMQHGGMAALAREAAGRLAATNDDEEAELIELAASFYDRAQDQSAEQLSLSLIDFVQRRWYRAQGPSPNQFSATEDRASNRFNVARPALKQKRRRLKVGLLSTHFHASPIYFFGYGALARLQQHWDLIFFDRGSKQDWANSEFQAIAKDWCTVHALDTGALHQQIRSHDLDAIFDMGGWMDSDGLRALIDRPAKRQYKWVGGQSATTGLRCFDGFITDKHQSPPGSEALHSEPLIRLPSGYVSYVAPSYLPAPYQAPTAELWQLGVIANPAKLSDAFLERVSTLLQDWQNEQASYGFGLTLNFIDSRYQCEKLQQKLIHYFRSMPVRFVTPENHRAYLEAVSALHAVIDTFPYSGGLTTVEAMMLGVPTFTWQGALFLERHSIAHNRYAGFSDAELRAATLPADLNLYKKAQPILQSGSPRLNHDSVAYSLLQLM